MKLSEADVRLRKSYLGLLPEDEARLRSIQTLLRERSAEIIDRFYSYLLSHEHTRKMLQAPGLVAHLKKVQADYFDRLTSGVYDLAYFEDRLRVGVAHERVGLAPQWYMGAYREYLIIATDALRKHFGADRSGYLEAAQSLSKVIFLDMSLAIDAYIFKAQNKLEEKNTQLLELDEVKRQLTEMIVHDLQNPLAGIQSFLEHLGGTGRLDTEEMEALEEALIRCGDLGNMIQNVLQIRKMDENKLELYIEDIDLCEFASRCVAAFELVARKAGKKLSLNVPRRSVIVRSDQTILQRIVFNLVSNAIKHTRAGTAIEVGVRNSREILVSDNGTGIPKEFHNVIFERFGAGRAREAGLRIDTGLGLPFCRMAAHALGAELTLESGPGQGTIFRLVFSDKLPK